MCYGTLFVTSETNCLTETKCRPRGAVFATFKRCFICHKTTFESRENGTPRPANKQPNKTAARVFLSIPVSRASGASSIGVPFKVLPFKTFSHVDAFLFFILFRYLFIPYFDSLSVLCFVSLSFYSLFCFTHYTIICTIIDSHWLTAQSSNCKTQLF